MLIRHAGRRSGRAYETPVWAFRTDDGFLIALTYGAGTDWQRNLEAAGSTEALHNRSTWTLAEPHLVQGAPRDQPLPRIVRLALTLFRVRDFLHVTAQRTSG